MKQNQARSGGLHRREFLVLGSAATVGIAASVSASTNGPLGMLASARPQLSVGFADLTTGAPQRVRRAEAGFGERLTGAVRVTVHGLWRPELRRDIASSVDVSVFHALGDVTVPFLAWKQSPHSASPRVTFTTTIHPDGTLPVGVEHARPFSLLAAPARRLSKVFRTSHDVPVQETLAGSGALCSLTRRGTYFVALPDGQSQPRWEALTAGVDLTASSILRAGDAPVDFDYLVISIDRA
jgi:hypothetical protein